MKFGNSINIIEKSFCKLKCLSLSNIDNYFGSFKEEVRSFRYPVPLYRRLANPLKSLKFWFLKDKCLHIGCGTVKLYGWINIDAIKTSATDFVCKVEDLHLYVKPNSIYRIYACHLLEHFSNKDAVQLLKMFHSFLVKGGEIRIAVPNMENISELVKNPKLIFLDKQHIQIYMSGNQTTKYQYHKSAYWFDYLKEILERIGYGNISIYNSQIKDSSQDMFDKTLMSLNVKGFKNEMDN